MMATNSPKGRSASISRSSVIRENNRYIGFLTFALNYSLHGLDVTGYHVVNLLIHTVNALLIYLLVMLTFRAPLLQGSSLWEQRRNMALVCALLFAVHPLQTQAVTYIWQRVASLATMFCLMSLVSYIKYRLYTGDRGAEAQGQREDTGNDEAGGALRWLFYAVSVISAVLAMKVKGEQERALTFLLGAYFALWATTFWMARFLLPFSALGSIVIILALTGKNPSRGRLRAVTALVVAAVLVHGAVLFRDEPTRRTFRPALGLESGDEYLRGLLRVYPAVEFINHALPADARILVLGETRVAYLERDHLFQSVFDRPLVDTLVGGERDPDAVVASLKEEGLTHVLLNLAELERLERARRVLPFSKEILRILLDHLRSRGDLLFSGNRVYLFRL